MTTATAASTIRHDTIAIERHFTATAARVFAAWSDRDALLEWSAPGEGWFLRYDRFDFRVGETDRCVFGETDGAEFINHVRYDDIVPARRIVYASTIASGDALQFSGLVTLVFDDAAGGCAFALTEQGAYLDGRDTPQDHRAGWEAMLEQLREYLARLPS